MSGIYSNGLGSGQVTIPELLKPVGYQTGMVGNLGEKARRRTVPSSRFVFYGTMTGAGSFYDPYAAGTPSSPRSTRRITITDRIGTEAARQIGEFAKSDKPFFNTSPSPPPIGPPVPPRNPSKVPQDL